MGLAIITDSTSYLSQDYIDHHGIRVLPLMVNFSDQSYREMVDITNQNFYKKMEESDEIPSSSQPSYGEILGAMQDLAKDHDRILGITISSGISGTYDSFSMAAKEIEGAEVQVVDSKLTCRFLANYIDEAILLDQAGKTLDEIVSHIEKLKEETGVILSVNNLQNFRKSGRISNAAGFLGDILQIRPILEFDDGIIVAKEKMRTSKKVSKYMLDHFDQIYQKHDGKVKAIFLECFPGSNHQVKSMKAELKNKYPTIKIEEDIVGPVIGTHTGPTVYALGWMPDRQN